MNTLTTSAASFTDGRTSTAVHTAMDQSVYVVATTLAATARALKVARALASEYGREITMLVSPHKRITISSARAHVYDLPIEDPDGPRNATPEAVRDLVASERGEAHVLVKDTRGARDFAQLLPLGASVVLAGPIHQFVETREQRLARKLTNLGYDVTFLPCAEAQGEAS